MIIFKQQKRTRRTERKIVREGEKNELMRYKDLTSLAKKKKIKCFQSHL